MAEHKDNGFAYSGVFTFAHAGMGHRYGVSHAEV